jgi:hypothetical protein
MTHAVCSRSFPLLVYLGHAFPGESIKGHMVFYCVDELLSYLLKKISSTHMKLEKVGNLCVAVSHLSLICMGIVSLIPLPMSLGFFPRQISELVSRKTWVFSKTHIRTHVISPANDCFT